LVSNSITSPTLAPINFFSFFFPFKSLTKKVDFLLISFSSFTKVPVTLEC